MQFYMAGKLAASGRVAGLYHRPAYEPLLDELRASGERICAYPFNRPAFAAFASIPLSWFSYRTALLVAAVGNLLLLILLVWKLPAWFGLPAWSRPCLAVFPPFLLAVGMGQDILLVTVLVAGAVRLASTGREAPAGVLLAFCAVKPHLIWALPVALLVAGKRRMLWSFLATTLVLTGISLAAVGSRGVEQWFALLRAPSTDYQPGSMVNVRALALHWGAAAGIAAAAIAALGLGLVLRRGSFQQKLAASLLASLLLSPHTYSYDLSLLAIAAPLAGLPGLLLPWAYAFSRPDSIPWILASLASLAWIAARAAAQHERAA